MPNIPSLILKVASLFFMILRWLIRRFLVRRNYLQGERSRGRYTNELYISLRNQRGFLGWRELLVNVHIVVAPIFDFIAEIATLGESPNPSIFLEFDVTVLTWRFRNQTETFVDLPQVDCVSAEGARDAREKERKLETTSRARNGRLWESLKHWACTGKKRLKCRLMKYWLLSTVFVCMYFLRAVRSDSNVAFHVITGATFEPGLNKTAAVFSASFQFVPYRTLSWKALTNLRRASQ